MLMTSDRNISLIFYEQEPVAEEVKLIMIAHLNDWLTHTLTAHCFLLF